MLGNYEKMGGGLTIPSLLGLSWVMVPLGPWSLEKTQGAPVGKWSRPALEARLRIWIHMDGHGKPWTH